MNTSWNGPSTRSMIRRLQDVVLANRESSDASFLYVRQDMTDVQNHINNLEKRLKDLEGRPAAPTRRSVVHCSICGEAGHLANNSKFHPLMMPVVRASGPVQAVIVGK